MQCCNGERTTATQQNIVSFHVPRHAF